MSAAPFVVGQWVRGEEFYGRRALIAEILGGERDRLWIVGARRIGKTSLLKQLERLAVSRQPGLFPLFWDFQGAESPEELAFELGDALLDAEDRLSELGIGAGEVEAGDPAATLDGLRRRLRARGLQLFLLGDEVEDLLGLGRQHPELLASLHRALAAPGGRTVLAAAQPPASPFGETFDPPLYLPALADGEARALIRQDHLPSGARPPFAERTVETLRRRCGNHPYLIQQVAKRALELGDLDPALEEVAADPMARHFFCRDFETLTAAERRILRFVAQEEPATGAAIRRALDLGRPNGDRLGRLANLGYLRRDRERRWRIANAFFRRWLGELPAGEAGPPPSAVAADGVAAAGRTPEELLPLVYDELRQRARRFLARERPDHTLQATAVVHEAYLRLVDQTRVDWKGRTHFLAVGAQAMRRLLIDHARGHRRRKRGGDLQQVTLDESAWGLAGPSLAFDELLTVDAAVEELRRVSERQAEIVELRFYSGLKVQEIAEHLGLSRRTVQSEWARARSWLEARLGGGEAGAR